MEEVGVERIPITTPSITSLEIEYVTDAVTNAWRANQSIYHERFEREFARYVGREHAVALPSGTAALHLALAALDLRPGDEVVVADSTWIASSAPVAYVGATPVFADVDPESWCIEASQLEACLTPQTKAVMVVDLYGSLPNYDPLLELAADRGIAVIEDAAEAVGSSSRGRMAGSFGTIGCFSFHGTKTMTTGEGGMLVTDSAETRERVDFLRDHGRPRHLSKWFWNTEVAYKYKLSNMQAALGLAQLHRMEELVDRKREIFSWYRDRLEGRTELRLNAEPAGLRNSFWMMTAVLDEGLGLSKEEVIGAMDERGIDCRPFFYPLSSLPAYADSLEAARARDRNANAYALSRLGFNLPCGYDMTQSTVDYICSELEKVLAADKVRRPAPSGPRGVVV